MIVLALKSVKYGRDWMFASETRAIAIAIAEPVPLCGVSLY
jgi:hypothetical protein